MTRFRRAGRGLLRRRRAFGYKLVEHARLLPRFAAYLEAAGAEVVRIELALAWSTERDLAPDSVVAAMRLLVARGFARYMVGIEP
jgi:hypothetical protein